MDLIHEIRRRNGFGQAMEVRAANDVDIAAFRTSMQQNLEEALKNLSEELYSKPTHFIFEFIQNADDNIYTAADPTLEIRINNSEVSFHCNEVGFTASDVEAICKVGQSAKKHAHGFIGEKGIGFKSAFKVADVIHVYSGPYAFKFDKRETLGMITPIWAADERPVSPGWTSFYLDLSRDVDGKVLAQYAEHIEASVLLFLRKLHSLKIDIKLRDSESKSIVFNSSMHAPDTVILEVNGTAYTSSTRYLRIQHSVKTVTDEPKRINIQQSDIILAFPLDMDWMPVISIQNVHAFLPLRKYGFTFIIQADFLTTTSREDILSSLRWNLTLRAGVEEAFLEAVERFKQHPTLEYIWVRFLPNRISDSFFGPMATSIQTKLANAQILRSLDMTYRLPSQVLIIPAHFQGDDTNQPLIPEEFLPIQKYYLSTAYNVNEDGHHLRALGVRDMSDTDFINGLWRMQSQFSEQSDDWHETVCTVLAQILKRNHYFRHDIWPDSIASLKYLKIIPLSNGDWISSHNTRDVFFDLKYSNIPNDLGLSSIKESIEVGSPRYQLYEKLGVKTANAFSITNKILELHKARASEGWTKTALISHAKFLFSNRYLQPLPLLDSFQVMDENEDVTVGSALYMDFPGLLNMRDALPQPPARFLHPDYLQAYDDESSQDWWQWRQWIRSSLFVNVLPRLIHGELSPEFIAMSATIGSRELLLILKLCWPQWLNMSPTAIVQLAQSVVICEDQTSQMISATYIGRKSLRRYNLPFLPIDDPDNNQWDFLIHLGVSTEVTVSFFIKRLVQLQHGDCNDEGLIQDTYKQLDARFDDDPYGIRNIFQTYPLFFDPGRKAWIDYHEVVWSGPQVMKSKVALSGIYPFLEDFFCVKLLVNNPPMQDLLVDELALVSREYMGTNITPAIKDHLLNLLIEISGLLRMKFSDTPYMSFDGLVEDAIFPVQSSTGLVLCKSSDRFYVPDNAKYEKMCRGHVPLLSIDRAQLTQIQPFLDSGVFKPRVLYLSTAVQYNSVTRGIRVLDQDLSVKYAKRSNYIERFVRHVQQCDPSSRDFENLASLMNISVFLADSVISTFRLDDFECTDADTLTVEVEPAGLSIILSKRCHPDKRDLFICERLGQILGVPKDKLQCIILLPVKALDVWLDMEGVPMHEANLHPSDFTPQQIAVTPPRNQADPTPVGEPLPIIKSDESLDSHHQPERQAKPQALRMNNESSPQDRAIKIEKGKQGRKRSAVKETESNNPSYSLQDDVSVIASAMSHLSVTSGQARPERHVKQETEQVLPQLSSPARERPISAPFNNFPQRQSPNITKTVDMGLDAPTILHPRNPIRGDAEMTMYEQHNGILGESFVYTQFSRVLPGFGPDNWTSEIRGLAPGFAPYEGPAVADFIYRDDQGVLTGLWYGEETREAWRNRWPIYHVEVKATSSEAREPFHMSRRQLEIALKFTRRDWQSIPREVLALMRVYGVRTYAPSFTVYLDPHRYLYEGGLQIVSDADVLGIL